ncbi:colicin D domain-containing protein [Thermoactinomyces sp. DSM 45892]|uniref:colicin D domain-containing protein n=1 Tax=Thermoactinomyces sp. DSM 45892 TaxID=1882753 RepID=UPI000898B31E|nr:colicin D domain-containing protein [Thermoactinomyces sp. DSM 45892]SDY31251.1 RHS repeat-associated core domain-containing protein [Thermoactinomyces sp. DSM 45892]
MLYKSQHPCFIFSYAVKGSSADTERKQFEYVYDINDNIISMKDSSSNKKVDEYRTVYTPLNQVKEVQEVVNGIVKRGIQYDYDVHGNLLKQEYSNNISEYSYNGLDQVTQYSQKKSAQDKPQIYNYQYTVSGQTKQETKPNGTVTDYQYNVDGSMAQWETKKTNGTSLQKHTYEYDLHGNPTKDVYTGLDANNKPINNTYAYTYDPRDRLVRYDKSGTQTSTEEYVLDANSNLVQKTKDGILSTYKYDKNRLIEETEAGLASKYIYDAMGRVEKITSDGKDKETFTYDQFDRTVEHTKLDKDKVTTIKSRFAYDPLDRTTAKVEKAGTANEKTTTFNYLDTSDQVLSEEVAGKVTRSYTYSAWGERMTMLKEDTKELSYFEAGNHGIEMLTDEKGNIRSTYGYTPYGEDDKDMFTGVDKIDATKPDQDMYNPFRYEGKRWDPNTKSYDLGFRDYRPGEGRFLTSDSYNGAGAHLALMMNTGNYNLYGYAGGNPISNSDPDGHFWGKLWDKAKSVGNSIVSGAKEVYNTVASGVKQAYNTVSSGVKKVYNKVKSGVKKVYNKVKKVAKKVYNTVKKAYNKVKKTVKKIVNKVKNVVKKVVKPAVKKIVNTVKKVTQSATKSVSQFIRGASDRTTSNMTLGIFNPEDPYEEKGIPYYLGAITGDVLTMMVGVGEVIGSVGGAVISAGPTAGASVAIGVAGATYGSGTVAGSFGNLSKDVSDLISLFSKGGGGSSNPINFSSGQLQKKFKHAKDFGVEGNYNKANAAKFEEAMQAHIKNPDTQVIPGTYRGKMPVTHYFNPNTGLNVMSDAVGNFHSGWELGQKQIEYLLKNGNVQ